MTEADFRRLSALARALKAGSRPGCAAALETQLSDVMLIDSGLIPANYISPRSRVTISDESSGEIYTYQLAFPADADISNGRISVLSPLGAALLGRRSGDTLDYESPGGPMRIRIDQVSNDA